MKMILPVILFFVCSIETSVAESPEWLTFPAGLDFTLTEENGVSSVRIPVRIGEAGVLIAELKAVIRDVAFDGKRPESLARLLKVTVDQNDPSDSTRGPSLVVLAESTLSTPGTYLILMDLVRQGTNQPLQDQIQPITVRITRSEPDVNVSSLLLVDQEYGFWQTTTRSSRLLVSETSGETSLTGVSITDVRDPVGAQPIDDGLLNVQLPQNNLAAGSSTNATVDVAGEFPLQTTAGSLELRADQLNKPVVVNYQVRARRTPHWIWVLSVAGFLLGWLIRVFLKERQQHLEARHAASAAVDDILQAMVSVSDTIVQTRLTEIQKVLQKAALQAKPSDIQEAVIAARTGLRTILDDFSERRSQLMVHIVPLTAILQRGWMLPQPMMDLLEQLRTELTRIANAVDGNSVTEAQRLLNETQTRSMVTICNGLHRWRRDMGTYFAELAAHPVPQTEQGAGFLRSAIDSWRSAFRSDESVLTLVDEKQLADALEKTHAAKSAAMDLLNHCLGEVPKLATWIDETLDAPLRPMMAEQLAELNQLNLLAAKVMLADLEQPEQAASELAARQLRLRRDWEGLLKLMLPNSVEIRAIHEALASDQWCLAIQRTADLLPNVRGGRSLPFDDMTVASKDTDSLPVIFRTAFAALGEQASLPLPATPRLDGSLSEQIRFTRGARLASFLQTLFFAGLFTVIASVLSSAQWVGTSPEMLGIFAWAFGVDITSDAVMSVAKNIMPQKLVNG